MNDYKVPYRGEPYNPDLEDRRERQDATKSAETGKASPGLPAETNVCLLVENALEALCEAVVLCEVAATVKELLYAAGAVKDAQLAARRDVA